MHTWYIFANVRIRIFIIYIITVEISPNKLNLNFSKIGIRLEVN